MFGLIVVNDVLFSTASISLAFAVSGGVGRAAIVVAVAALVGTALALLFGFLQPALVYATAVAVVAAQLVFAWSAPDSSDLPGTWWGWQLMIPVCVLIGAALPLSRAVPVLAMVVTVYAVLRLSPASGPGNGIHARSPTCPALPLADPSAVHGQQRSTDHLRSTLRRLRLRPR